MIPLASVAFQPCLMSAGVCDSVEVASFGFALKLDTGLALPGKVELNGVGSREVLCNSLLILAHSKAASAMFASISASISQGSVLGLFHVTSGTIPAATSALWISLCSAASCSALSFRVSCAACRND